MLYKYPKLKKLWNKAVKEEGVTKGDIVTLKGGEHTDKFKEELIKKIQESVDRMDKDAISMVDSLLWE